GSIVSPVVLKYAHPAVFKPEPVEILQSTLIKWISLDVVENVTAVWFGKQRQATFGIEWLQLEGRRTTSSPCCLQAGLGGQFLQSCLGQLLDTTGSFTELAHRADAGCKQLCPLASGNSGHK